MPFKKGQSGNPSGRPLKNRAFTDILERAGANTVEYNGKKLSGKRLLGVLVWQGATIGEITLPDGKVLKLSPRDWMDMVKWLYAQIDGPPKSEFDVTSGGEAILKVMYVNDWRTHTTIPAPGTEESAE